MEFFKLHKIFFFVLIIELMFVTILCKKTKGTEKPAWAKKDIRDYSEADLERLLDQWEVCYTQFNLPLFDHILFIILTMYCKGR